MTLQVGSAASASVWLVAHLFELIRFERHLNSNNNYYYYNYKIIIMIIIIAFKCAIRKYLLTAPRTVSNTKKNRIERRNSRFLTIFSLPHESSPTRTLKWPGRNRVQITCNTSSAYHVQRVVLLATWYEGTAQLLNLTESQ